MTYFNESIERQYKKKINLWVSLASISVFSNLLLSGLCWYSIVNQKIEVTPFYGNQSYVKSDTSVDGRYLDQISENFINARLNVTPHNVKANQKRILTYVNSRSYHKFSGSLLREQKYVINKQISSYFDIGDIKSTPENLSSVVTGTLRRFVGLRELASQKVRYEIKYKYHLGRISIISFEKKGVAGNV